MNRTLRITALLLAALFALLLFGCGKDKSPNDEDIPGAETDGDELLAEYPVEAGGVLLAARPSRVISLAPALTEKLYDLGMSDRLVGISDYCDYPGSIEGLPLCGTAQIPDLEVIERLAPDLVLAESELPDEAAEYLEELEIPVAVLPRAETVDTLAAGYVDLARLMDGEHTGRTIGESVAAEYRGTLRYLGDILADYTAQEGRKTALYLRLPDFTVATGDSFEQELMDVLCLDNIAAGYQNWTYPEEDAKSAEGLAAFQSIDLLFMDPKDVSIEDLEKNDFYRGLPAVLGDRYLYISSIVIERQSLRTLHLLAEMARAAYPEAEPPGGYDIDDSFLPEPDIYGGDEEARAEGDDMLDALDEMMAGIS